MEREEFIAEVRHIGWVAYQIAVGQEYNEKINNDQMGSLLDGIEYLDSHQDITPEENHNNWMKMKESQGWVYGEIKDFDKRRILILSHLMNFRLLNNGRISMTQ